MNQPTLRLPRPLYYLLVTTLTEMVLVSGAILILLPTDLLKQIPLAVLGIVLILKTITATFSLTIVDRNRWHEKNLILKGGGLILGHVVGLLLGGMLGSHYGGTFWAIAGAIGLYLIVGRIGSKISLVIGNQLDRQFSSSRNSDSNESLRLARPNSLWLLLYGMVLPVLFVVIAILLQSSGISVSPYSEKLPIARVVAITLSLFSILLPWWVRTRWIMKPPMSIVSGENAIFLLGRSSSMAPMVYGFFLFLAFGASIVELGAFAAASSLAAIVWNASTRIRQRKLE